MLGKWLHSWSCLVLYTEMATLAHAFPGGSGAAPAPGSTRAQPMMRSEAMATVDAQGSTKLFPALGSLLSPAPKPDPSLNTDMFQAVAEQEDREMKEDEDEPSEDLVEDDDTEEDEPVKDLVGDNATDEEHAEELAETNATEEEHAEELAENNATEEEHAEELAENDATEEEHAGELAENDATEEEHAEELAENNATEEVAAIAPNVMSDSELTKYKANICGHEGGTCNCNGVAFFGTPDGDGVRVEGSIKCSSAELGGTKRAATGKTPCLCYTLKWCTDNNEFKQVMDAGHRRRSIVDAQGINLHQRRRWCGWGPRNCVWDTWGRWTSCSVTCDTGKKTRTRTRVLEAANGGVCQGESSDSVTCYMPTCPRRRRTPPRRRRRRNRRRRWHR